VIKAVKNRILCFCADLVRRENKFLMMELELVEPSLYLPMDAKSLKRFAAALEKRI